MDVVFNCPKCDQELAVDSSGAGSEIQCPACNETIVIPEPETPVPRPAVAVAQAIPAPVAPGAPAVEAGQAHPVNAIDASAARKVELHLKVPSVQHSESLIAKPLVPLEVAAKGADKKIRSRTIRHTDCIEVGHDKYDEVVTNFLNKIGEANIINITPINYTNLDIGTQKLMTEYGVFIIYRG